MAKKVKLTRPELKRQRDALERFARYLPMLKLKQQQLQLSVRNAVVEMQEADTRVQRARSRFGVYSQILRDEPGLDVETLARPTEIKSHQQNIAGVRVPAFDSAEFAQPTYSLFATPPWVDQALTDLRKLNERQAKAEIVGRRHDLLAAALIKIIQRVNLFDKVLIPQAQEAIRVIRIHLGEEQTAAVGRAKLAKGKIAEQVKHVPSLAGAGGRHE